MARRRAPRRAGTTPEEAQAAEEPQAEEPPAEEPQAEEPQAEEAARPRSPPRSRRLG